MATWQLRLKRKDAFTPKVLKRDTSHIRKREYHAAAVSASKTRLHEYPRRPTGNELEMPWSKRKTPPRAETVLNVEYKDVHLPWRSW